VKLAKGPQSFFGNHQFFIVGIGGQKGQHTERQGLFSTEVQIISPSPPKRKYLIYNRNIPLLLLQALTPYEPKIPITTAQGEYLFIPHIRTILLTELGHSITIKVISCRITHNRPISLTLFKY
jgi:hypothetical protein